MAEYNPKPGTVAYRALAHLATLEHGAEITSSRFSEALGVDVSSLRACLQPALSAGRVFCRQKDREHVRSPLFWSLTDHDAHRPVTPPPGPQTPLQRAPAPAAAPRPAPSPTPVAELCRETLDPAAATPPGIAQSARQRRAQAAKPAEQDHFAAALWTNGVLQIERGDDLLLLSAEQTQAVRRLLLWGAVHG